MLGPGNSVIVVEPVNEQTTGRQEEVRAEVTNPAGYPVASKGRPT